MRRWSADCAFAALAMTAKTEVSERTADRRIILADIAVFCRILSRFCVYHASLPGYRHQEGMHPRVIGDCGDSDPATECSAMPCRPAILNLVFLPVGVPTGTPEK
jgi:hypothetical protein